MQLRGCCFFASCPFSLEHHREMLFQNSTWRFIHNRIGEDPPLLVAKHLQGYLQHGHRAMSAHSACDLVSNTLSERHFTSPGL